MPLVPDNSFVIGLMCATYFICYDAVWIALNVLLPFLHFYMKTNKHLTLTQKCPAFWPSCSEITLPLEDTMKWSLASKEHASLISESDGNDSVSACHNVGHAAIHSAVLSVCVCVALQSLHKAEPKALAWTKRAAAEGIWEYAAHVVWKFKTWGSSKSLLWMVSWL